jgi:hypothetical protein
MMLYKNLNHVPGNSLNMNYLGQKMDLSSPVELYTYSKKCLKKEKIDGDYYLIAFQKRSNGKSIDAIVIDNKEYALEITTYLKNMKKGVLTNNFITNREEKLYTKEFIKFINLVDLICTTYKLPQTSFIPDSYYTLVK